MALALVGSAGLREIVVDLSGAGDLTILPVENQRAIKAIKLSGETTATTCTITLRSESTSGPIIWYCEAVVTAVTRFHEHDTFDSPKTISRGLFINTAAAWSAASRLIIYTA